jgi:hypothetical protein
MKKNKIKVYKLLKFTFLVLIILFNFSCEKNPPVSINRSLKIFNSIAVQTPVMVFLYQANYTFVRLEGDKSDLLNILTTTINSKLNISADVDRNIINDSASLVVVQCKDLISIEHNTAGKIIGKMPMQLKDLSIVNKIEGKITLSGNAQNLEIQNLGIGKIDLTNLYAVSANIKSEGDGNIFVNVSNTLNANILGRGNIYYKGNPRITSNLPNKVIKLD